MDSNHTLKIETPPDIAQGVNGEPAYIIVKTRFKNKYQMAFSEVNQLSTRLNQIVKQIKGGDTSPETEAEGLRLTSQVEAAIEAIWETFATLVLDWNWLDPETGAPLPKPNGNLDAFKREIDDEQTSWIRDKIQNIQRYRATEGNAPSGNGSSPG